MSADELVCQQAFELTLVPMSRGAGSDGTESFSMPASHKSVEQKAASQVNQTYLILAEHDRQNQKKRERDTRSL